VIALTAAIASVGLACERTALVETSAPSTAAPIAPESSVILSGDAPPPSATAQSNAPPSAVARDPRCPSEMVRIGGYCIDRWEAHVVNDDGVVHPRNVPLADGHRYTAKSAAGVFPQGHINRHQAAAACERAEKRLCAWIEWRRACQGAAWRRWPYGNELADGACNSGKTHLIRKLFGDDPNAWSQAKFNDPRLNEQPGFLAKTGSHQACVSPDGAYDMVGNLHEWVIDSVSKAFLQKMQAENMSREKQPHALGNGMFLGGFYSTRSEHGEGCFFVTVAHSPKYYDYSTGFRCCKDAAAE
jgi:formylglycine-generating enzyme required for sulfatase activity